MQLGQAIPNFSFQATSNIQAELKDYQGQTLVLYFYPKDATPGCTQEGLDFAAAYAEFQKLNAQVFGVSRDTLKSHEKFKEKQGYPFELISDSDEQLCHLFDVIKMKSMYGKEVRGIERSTFIIDTDGQLKQEWRKVSVKGHVDDVLKFLQS